MRESRSTHPVARIRPGLGPRCGGCRGRTSSCSGRRPARARGVGRSGPARSAGGRWSKAAASTGTISCRARGAGARPSSSTGSAIVSCTPCGARWSSRGCPTMSKRSVPIPRSAASSLGCGTSRRPSGRPPALLAAALLGSFALALLAVPARSQTPASAEELVRARCGNCHGRSLPDLLVSCRERRGEEGLDRFLARHHARDLDERRQIVAWLQACAAGELPPPR